MLGVGWDVHVRLRNGLDRGGVRHDCERCLSGLLLAVQLGRCRLRGAACVPGCKRLLARRVICKCESSIALIARYLAGHVHGIWPEVLPGAAARCGNGVGLDVTGHGRLAVSSTVTDSTIPKREAERAMESEKGGTVTHHHQP